MVSVANNLVSGCGSSTALIEPLITRSSFEESICSVCSSLIDRALKLALTRSPEFSFYSEPSSAKSKGVCELIHCFNIV